MTQKTQVDTVAKTGQGNTNLDPSTRSRYWCFTLNNYTEEDITNITILRCDYVFQEEKGENGTPHLQGILMFKNACSFRSVKKKIPRAHIERCKNKLASIKYCSKPDTRVGEIYHRYKNFDRDRHNDTGKSLKKKIDPQSSEEIEKRQKTLDEFFESEEWEKFKNCKALKYVTMLDPIMINEMENKQ